MQRHFEHFLYAHTDIAQFLRFAMVGLKVSLIDIGGVYLLPWLWGMDLYLARLISLSSAILAGYLLNRSHGAGCLPNGPGTRRQSCDTCISIECAPACVLVTGVDTRAGAPFPWDSRSRCFFD